VGKQDVYPLSSEFKKIEIERKKCAKYEYLKLR
jgi:hypothetical protein